MQNTILSTQNDEIDLRELLATIVKRKLTVIAITTITTIAAAFYAWNAAPIYKGEVLIEIGYVIMNAEPMNDKPTIVQTLDSPNDLKEAVLQVMAPNDTAQKKHFSVESPKGSSNLIKVSNEDTNKDQIKRKLEDTVALVLKRHKSKAEFFKKANAHIHPSAIVSSISIAPDPIKPRKQFIIVVALISGLIIGIFLAFFMEFIQNSKTRREQ